MKVVYFSICRYTQNIYAVKIAAQKMIFFIKDLFSLREKSLMENFTLCAVDVDTSSNKFIQCKQELMCKYIQLFVCLFLNTLTLSQYYLRHRKGSNLPEVR